MNIPWAAFWPRTLGWLKMGWLIAAVLMAAYGGLIRPSYAFRGIAMEKTTALASIERNRHWLLPLPRSLDNATLAAGVIGGVPNRVLRHGAPALSYSPTPDRSADQKIIRTSSIDLLVKNPAQSAEKIRALTEDAGGFLVRSQTNGGQNATSATLTIRVPVARAAEVEAGIRMLSLQVESERTEAEDMTGQYVDRQARLRNFRAQETQYLTILKQARSVKDTLDVSEKLNGIRVEIEQQQAEFAALSKQVETVAITVSLRSEAEANPIGIHWRPSYELKLAAMQGLEGLADYATAMFSLVFYLPAILLWLVTLLAGVWFAWNLLRRAVRLLFVKKLERVAPLESMDEISKS